MGEIVHWVDAPRLPRPMVGNLPDPVEGRVAHVDIGRCHVYLGPQNALSLIEFTLFHLPEEGEMIQLQIQLPDAIEHQYRFRAADLSPQGQRILQNFKSTLRIAGRPLSPDERRQVVLALLHSVLGGEDA